MADAVSHRQIPMGSPSATLMTKAPPRNSVTYMRKMADACFALSAATLRPNSLALSCRRNTANAVVNITATVVTFIPPAVEPGAPPISISVMVSAWPGPSSSDRGTVLYPAVRGVTAANREQRIRSAPSRPPNSYR